MLIITSFWFASIIKSNPSLFLLTFIMKIFVYATIWFVEWLNNRNRENFYFYFNQGLSLKVIYTFTIVLDLILFIIITLSLWQF